MLHNVMDMTHILHQLQQEGYPVNRTILAHVSPYLTEHVRRFGEYVLDLSQPTFRTPSECFWIINFSVPYGHFLRSWCDTFRPEKRQGLPTHSRFTEAYQKAQLAKLHFIAIAKDAALQGKEK